MDPNKLGNMSKGSSKISSNASSQILNSVSVARQSSHYYQIYHIGIIDYLQEWSFPKQFENKVKVFYNKKNRNSISAVHPKRYQERFHEFLLDNVTKPAYENFKTNVGYMETCENFVESMIVQLRLHELNSAGITMHSVLR